MDKKVSGKWIGIAAAALVAVVAAIVFCIFFFGRKEDSYRSIQIYDLDGTATITREGIGEIAAIENLYLDSGDRILVGAGSVMRLKLDEDKYILVEENSVLSLIAEGTSENSKTSINLEQGAITNEIQNPLSENSMYNVTTPNSVMAVRGTIFRVEVLFDEVGEVYTKVSTFEGSVGSSLVFPDGTRQEEVLFVEGGNEAIIRMSTEITEYVQMPMGIDYSQTPLVTLTFLQEIAEERTELVGISLTEIQELIEEKEEEQRAAEQGETQEESEESQENPDGEEDSDAPAQTKGTGTSSKTEGVTEESTQSTQESGTDSTETAGTTDNSGSGGTSGNGSTYTVIFSYNGTEFGRQTVMDGDKAVAPKLAPAQTGGWNFDFSTEIHGDTTIYWK